MHARRSSVHLLVGCAFLAICAPASPQLLGVKHDAVNSAVLKQNRPVDIYLPEQVEKNPAKRYETLYVLDGDWNAQTVVNVVSFMRQVEFIPPVIVVSIPNVIDPQGVNSRDHDLTPTVVADEPDSGGAAQFLSFLKTELIPYVDAHYPTNHINHIHGHSYGGLFLMYALLHEPALFDGYVILDPAMHWDQHALNADIDAHIAGVPTKGKAIYIAGRSGRAFDYMGLSAIEPLFKNKAPPDLHWRLLGYPGESHDSLKLKGTYDALKFIFNGSTTAPIHFFPTSGIVIKGKPVFLLLDGGAERIDLLDLHYSTDGSLPTAASPQVDVPLAVSDPEATKIRLLSTRGIYDRDVPLGLRSGAVLPPDRRAGAKTDFWHVAVYPADAWGHFRRSHAFKTFDTDQALRFAEVGRDAFAGTVERNLDIPADGYYVFGTDSSGKLRLSVAGRQLIDNDDALRPTREAVVMPLQRGVYRMRLEFQRAVPGAEVSLVIFPCKDDEPEWWNHRLFTVSSRPLRD
jgi:predicted alpha/beta superfamily hydrolase